MTQERPSIPSSKLHGYSPRQLFRVDRPREVLAALCAISTPIIDSKAFKKAYEEQTGLPITPKTAQTLCHFLLQFGFLKKTQVRKQYDKTDLGKEACDAREEIDHAHYQRVWAQAILQQQLKTSLFRNFFAFIEESKSRDEVLRKFKRNANVLIALTKEGNLASEEDGLIYSHQTTVRSIGEFWSRVEFVYNKLSRTSVPGARRSFVEITELRNALLPFLDWRNPKHFDTLLAEVAGNKEYRRRIEFSGAPVSYVEEKGLRPFELDGKRFYYLSIAD